MLENGKSYRVKLALPWELEYEVMIIGETNPDHIEEFGKFDLKGEFFDRYNLGMGTYLSLIRSTTPIYICRKIESRSPIVLEDRPSLFIPAPIIDYNATKELLTCVDITYRAHGITRYFTGKLSEGEYLNATAEDVQAMLKAVDNLRGDNVAVDYEIAESLYEKGFIEQMDEERNNLQAEARGILDYQHLKEEERIAIFVQKTHELDVEKRYTINQKRILDIRIQQLTDKQAGVDADRRYIENVKNSMISIIEQIRAGQYNPANFPTFTELWDAAQQEG